MQIMADPSVEPEPEPESHFEDNQDIHSEGEPEIYANGTSEPEPKAIPEGSVLSEPETITWTLLYLLLITSTLIVNAFIIRAMTKRLSSKCAHEGNCIRKPSDMFLLSLIVARMNVAGFVMPARIMGMFSSRGIGPVVCKLCAFAGTGSAATSVFCTCAVGINKVIELKRREVPPRKWIVKMIALLWVVGHIYALREPFLNDIVERENSHGEISFICAEIPRYRTIAAVFIMCDILLLFVIPSVIVVSASAYYIKLSSKPPANGKRANNSSILGFKKQTVIAPTETNSGMVATLDNEAKRSADTRFMALIILFLFVFCYAAAYTWKALLFTGSVAHLNMETALTIEQSLYLWTFLNPILNACTYLYFRLDIRVRFKSIFKDMDAEGECKVSTTLIHVTETQCEKSESGVTVTQNNESTAKRVD